MQEMDKTSRGTAKNMKLRSIVSVLAGLVTIFVTGLILFPVLKLIVEKNLVLFEKGYSAKDFIMDLSGFLYVGVAALLGGFVSSTIATSRTIFHSFITGVIAFAVALIIKIVMDKYFGLENLLSISGLFFFAVMGGMIQKYFYIRKHKDV